MAGISPSATGGGMADVAALAFVEGRVADELRRERAAGQPLKTAFHAVARRLGLTARRVRAYHHREVAAADVRAAELLAAHAAMHEELAALRCRIEGLRGLLGADGLGGALGGSPRAEMAAARGSRRGEGALLAADRGLAAGAEREGAR